MRTNSTSFALTVGMALLIILMGFGVLSAAGLVGFAAEEEAIATQAPPEEFGCATKDLPVDYSASVSLTMSAEEKAGEALFEANCVQCHAINEKVVGPALAGITRRRQISWLVSWVRNPAKVIASGDEYAVKLFNDYGKQQMPSFKLSEKEITAIIVYVESRRYEVVVD
jgi:mono/diheme cytochrome c family protein